MGCHCAKATGAKGASPIPACDSTSGQFAAASSESFVDDVAKPDEQPHVAASSPSKWEPGKDESSGPEDDDKPVTSASCDWAAEASQAISKAQALMDADVLALQAEGVLAEALSRFEDNDAGAAGAAAAKIIRESQIYQTVAERVEQFNSIAEIVMPSSFQLLWSTEEASLWIHAPPNATWFEYKVAAFIDAPIHHTYVPIHELDLQTRFQPMLVGAPQYIGSRSRHLMVTRTLFSLLFFRIELIMEIMRFADTKFGFVAERFRSDFPIDELLLPPAHWRNKRVGVDVRNFVFPRGGGATGTISIQQTRVDVGVRIPESVLNFFANRMTRDYLNNLRSCAKLLQTPGNPWSERLAADVDDYYKELAEVEEAASRRAAFSLSELPGSEIFGRPHKL